MKGLLKKDLLLLWKNMKTVVVLVLVYAVVFGAQGAETAMSTMSIIFSLLGVMLPLYSLAYDSQARWDLFARALPVGKRQIVLSKYVLAVAFIGAGLAVEFAAALILSGALGLPWLLPQAAAVSLCMAAGCLLLLALEMPLYYRFGPEKARLLIFLMVALAAALGGALVSLQGEAGLPLAALPGSPVLAALAALLVVLCLAGSFFLSLRIYCKQEL